MNSFYEDKIYQVLKCLFCGLFFCSCSLSSVQQKSDTLQGASATRDTLSTISRAEDTQIRLSYPVHPEMISPQSLALDHPPLKLFENTKFFSFPVHQGEVTALALASDGLGVFTAGVDGRVVFSRLV